jgi:hypothetical protein
LPRKVRTSLTSKEQKMGTLKSRTKMWVVRFRQKITQRTNLKMWARVLNILMTTLSQLLQIIQEIFITIHLKLVTLMKSFFLLNSVFPNKMERFQWQSSCKINWHTTFSTLIYCLSKDITKTQLSKQQDLKDISQKISNKQRK